MINQLIEPDQTFKSFGLFSGDFTLVGYDVSNYTDFYQPIIKSYTVDCSASTVTKIFEFGQNITFDEHKDANKISIYITDATETLLTSPNTNIKIYSNILNSSDTTNAKFVYLISPSFEYLNISK